MIEGITRVIDDIILEILRKPLQNLVTVGHNHFLINRRFTLTLYAITAIFKIVLAFYTSK